jgi:lysine/ornithine N-monooxygenase
MLTSITPSRKADAQSIAVIGGGASGALITAHLLERADDDVHLPLIEQRAAGSAMRPKTRALLV